MAYDRELHHGHQGCTLGWIIVGLSGLYGGRCICRWECTHYQNHIPSPGLHPGHHGYTMGWINPSHQDYILGWIVVGLSGLYGGRCICRWECAHYQNHIPSPWLQHVTMIAPNHQGCTLDTMVIPWAELIHRTRITSWAELLSAFQAAWVAADSGHRWLNRINGWKPCHISGRGETLVMKMPP